MKDTEFLKLSLISNRGIYDNENVFENTLEAMKAAIDKNYAIYLSVQYTKDGVVVVYHDHDLTRLMNLKDKIVSTTYEELQFLCSYHIPTLAQALELIAGRVPVIINPRNRDLKYYLPKELAKILDEYNGKFAILNENATIIKWFNKYRPNYIVGEVITKHKKGFYDIGNFLANYSIVTDFKSVNIKNNDPHKTRSIKDKSIVVAYLVDNMDKYRQYKLVCDNLIIDNVNELDI